MQSKSSSASELKPEITDSGPLLPFLVIVCMSLGLSIHICGMLGLLGGFGLERAEYMRNGLVVDWQFRYSVSFLVGGLLLGLSAIIGKRIIRREGIGQLWRKLVPPLDTANGVFVLLLAICFLAAYVFGLVLALPLLKL